MVSALGSQSSGAGLEPRSHRQLDLFLGDPEFNYSATLVNSQLVASCQLAAFEGEIQKQLGKKGGHVKYFCHTLKWRNVSIFKKLLFNKRARKDKNLLQTFIPLLNNVDTKRNFKLL